MSSELDLARVQAQTALMQSTDMTLLAEKIDRLKSRIRLAVIFGGNKSVSDSVIYQSHNTRSWKSYEAVAEDIASALRRLGFRFVDIIPDDMRLGDRLRCRGIHMAWLNTGGMQGYNSAAHASAMLEMMGVPYVGHDPLAVTTLDIKHAFKRAAVCAGIPTAPFTTWHMTRGAFRPDINSRFKLAFGNYSGPFVVKPISGRASLHVHVVPDIASLPDAVAEVYRATENAVLIEQFLSGREYCIAVAGPVVAPGGRLMRRSQPLTFAAFERVLSPDEQIFTSMDHRPITSDRMKLLDPRQNATVIGELDHLAYETYLEFNLGSLVRLDLRSDDNGKLFVLEANPKPDLKKPTAGVTSLVGAGLPAVGMEYDDLILSLFADRLDFLLTHRRSAVQHLFELLETPSLFDFMSPRLSSVHAKHEAIDRLNDIATNFNVQALKGAVAAAKSEEETARSGAKDVSATHPSRLLKRS